MKKYKVNVGSAPNNYHLTTKEQEPEPGLYYFYARWYDLQVGRFITRSIFSPYREYQFFYSVNNNLTELVDWFLKTQELVDAVKACGKGKVRACIEKANAAENEFLDWCENFCICLFEKDLITDPKTRGCVIGCRAARRKMGIF